MTQQQIQDLLFFLPGLDFLLTLPGHYIEGVVCVFYSMIWIDPSHEFIQYMYKGRSFRIERADLEQLLRSPHVDT